jgi:hypothetical protein
MWTDRCGGPFDDVGEAVAYAERHHTERELETAEHFVLYLAGPYTDPDSPLSVALAGEQTAMERIVLTPISPCSTHCSTAEPDRRARRIVVRRFTGEKTELARMHISNTGGTTASRNYAGARSAADLPSRARDAMVGAARARVEPGRGDVQKQDGVWNMSSESDVTATRRLHEAAERMALTSAVDHVVTALAVSDISGASFASRRPRPKR